MEFSGGFVETPRRLQMGYWGFKGLENSRRFPVAFQGASGSFRGVPGIQMEFPKALQGGFNGLKEFQELSEGFRDLASEFQAPLKIHESPSNTQEI